MLVLVTYCDRHNDAPLPECPHSEGHIADVIKVIVIEIRRLSWIMQMCPICSHEFLKVENLFFLATLAKEMRRICPAVSDSEGGGRRYEPRDQVPLKFRDSPLESPENAQFS